MLTQDQQQAWADDGFFIVRAHTDQAICTEISDEAVSAIRNDPPTDHPGASHYMIGPILVGLESQPDMAGKNPEDLISKLFNSHLEGAAGAYAQRDDVTTLVAGALKVEDIDVFQSQFIFKNPGAWGQPWHQDSHYFPYDKQPHVGVWLALTEATLANGCLAVVPGSHKQPTLDHGLDRRAGANYGYLEIDEADFAADRATPVLMDAGDLLIFNSNLVHRSFDNGADSARQAMVYHYGETGAKLTIDDPGSLSVVNHWLPARRKKDN